MISLLLGLLLLVGDQAPGSCTLQGALPDPQCTPGDTLTQDADVVCVRGYASRVRDVAPQTRRAVLLAYGAPRVAPPGTRELDHLISLELGGANTAANLWPQPAPDYHRKDSAENWLHARVCADEMDLATAQQQIATDWTAVAAQMDAAIGR